MKTATDTKPPQNLSILDERIKASWLGLQYFTLSSTSGSDTQAVSFSFFWTCPYNWPTYWVYWTIKYALIKWSQEFKMVQCGVLTLTVWLNIGLNKFLVIFYASNVSKWSDIEVYVHAALQAHVLPYCMTSYVLGAACCLLFLNS